MSETRSPRRPRRLGAALVAALALVAVACERNADGSFSVDQAYLCVHPGTGELRWTASQTCGPDEILIRVDEPPAHDPGPQPRSWGGQVAMGATSPSVPADGAARSLVQLAAEETAQLGPNARCDLVVDGATTAVLGELWTWGISDVADATIDWADPAADNSVAATCAGQSGFSTPIQVSLSLVPVG